MLFIKRISFLDLARLCGHAREPMKIHCLFRLILCAFVVCLVGSATEARANEDPRPVVKIGVLADLSGSWSTLGKNTVAALQIAAADLDNIHPQYHPHRYQFLVRDTHLDPARALEAIMDLDQRGVKIIIGPQSSSEVAEIMPYANAHRILVISQGSTASSLALPGDNIFRFCPNDILEAEAIVALMRHDGIRAIVPLWRNDRGNNGLHHSVQTRFQALGGRVTPGFRYQPTTTDFSAATASVASQVENLIAGGRDPSTVGVYIAAFDEVVQIFHSASEESQQMHLRVRAYGSDGVALSAALLADPVAAAFAIHSGYPNPIFGLPDALRNRWQPIADAIEARTGIQADAFALSTYDALFVLNNALVHAEPETNFGEFKAAFVEEASHYHGITGSTALDAAGDRANGDFDFWAIRVRGGTRKWVRIGSYNNGVLTLF
jgi:branched-chain amino acid transport system substrate-binding protein